MTSWSFFKRVHLTKKLTSYFYAFSALFLKNEGLLIGKAGTNENLVMVLKFHIRVLEIEAASHRCFVVARLKIFV